MSVYLEAMRMKAMGKMEMRVAPQVGNTRQRDFAGNFIKSSEGKSKIVRELRDLTKVRIRRNGFNI